METISRLISEKCNLPILTEVSDSTGQYHMFNDGGVECEVGEFLYGLVRMMKPDEVLETGTHKGISSSYIGLALKANNKGKLLTMEINYEFLFEARKHWEELELGEHVHSFNGFVEEFPVSDMYDLILLDTEPNLRFAELVRFFDNLKPGGIFIIHDLHRHLSQLPNEKFFAWPYGELPQQMKDWLKDGDLKTVSFSTPRGITMFYKPRPDDYRAI